MLEAKPKYFIGDRAYDSDVLDDDLKQVGVNLIAHIAPPANSRPKMGVTYADIDGAGSSNASLRGSSGSGGSSFAGSITPNFLGFVQLCLHHDAPQAILR